MKTTTEEIQRIAEEGAGKYFPAQMELLKRFASIDCGTGDEEGNRKVIEILEELLIPMGFELEYHHVPGTGTHLVGRLTPKKSDGKILLMAHLDTVFSEGDAGKHPFHIDGDWAYGLGIADCKGGLLTAIFAVKTMLDARLLPDKEIIFLLNCDEETGSPSSYRKGIFDKETGGADFAFSFEPTREQNGVYTFRGGLAEGTIHVTGKAAHAQLKYFEGSSATAELANLILKLIGKNDKSKKLLYNVAPISGGKKSVVIADEARAVFAAIFESAAGLEQAKKDVRALEAEGIVEGCHIKTDLTVLFPPMERTAGNQKAYRLVKSAGEIMGLELPESSTSGSADICYTTNAGVPSIDCLGPFMRDIHSFDESMRVSSIIERTKLFSIILGIV